MTETSATPATTSPKRSLRDRLRIESYLVCLDWYLEGGLRGNDRKAILSSLRDELTTEPRDLTRALADLGSPKSLAARYTDEGVMRPLWSIGAIIAGGALLAYWVVWFSFVTGMLAALSSQTPGKAEATLLFVQVEVVNTADQVSAGFSGPGTLIVPAVIVAIALLLGSRAWRAFRRTA